MSAKSEATKLAARLHYTVTSGKRGLQLHLTTYDGASFMYPGTLVSEGWSWREVLAFLRGAYVQHCRDFHGPQLTFWNLGPLPYVAASKHPRCRCTRPGLEA